MEPKAGLKHCKSDRSMIVTSRLKRDFAGITQCLGAGDEPIDPVPTVSDDQFGSPSIRRLDKCHVLLLRDINRDEHRRLVLGIPVHGSLPPLELACSTTPFRGGSGSTFTCTMVPSFRA